MPKRTPTEKSIRKARRKSNEQLMQAAIERWGAIRIRVSLSLYVPETRQFAGWLGSGITVDVNSLDKARALYEGLQKAVENVARETGAQIQPVTRLAVRERK